MAFEYRMTRVAWDTGTGTQDITVSGWSETPDACMLHMVGATSDDTLTAHKVAAIGLCDGTNSVSLSLTAEDGQASSDLSCRGEHTLLQELALGGSGVDGEISFNSFISGGVRVNLDNAPDGAWFIVAYFFIGTSFSVGQLALPTSVGGTSSTTALGFELDAMLCFTLQNIIPDAGGDSYTHNQVSFGMVTYQSSTITQRAFGHRSRNGSSTANHDGQLRNDRCAINTKNNGDEQGLECTAVSSTGFTITARTEVYDSAASTELVYFAMADADHEFWLGDVAVPASAGNDSQTGPGFTPQGMLGIATQVQDINTAKNNSGEVAIECWFGADGTEEYCQSTTQEQGVTTTNTASFSDNTVLNVPQDDQTAGYEASWVSWDSGNGWTWNYSAVVADAIILVLVFEEAAGGPDTVSIAGSITPAGALSLQAQPATIDGSITPSGALSNEVQPAAFTGSITPAGSPSLVLLRSEDGSITPSGALTAAIAKAEAGSITPAGALLKQVDRAIEDGSITPSGALLKRVDRSTEDGSITPVGALSNVAQLAIDGSITPAGALATLLARVQEESGSITPTGVLLVQVQRSEDGSITPAGTLVKIAQQGAITGSITPTGVLLLQVLVLLSGSITPAGTLLAEQTGESISITGSITPAGEVVLLPQKLVVGSITPAGALSALVQVLFTGSITPAGTLLATLAVVSAIKRTAFRFVYRHINRRVS